MSKKFKFKTEMFMSLRPLYRLDAMEQAQAALDKHLESLPKISGVVNEKQEYNFVKDIHIGDTHTAVLFNLELIKKECNQHIPKIASRQVAESNPAIASMLGCSIVCANCGIELKPGNWSAK